MPGFSIFEVKSKKKKMQTEIVVLGESEISIFNLGCFPNTSINHHEILKKLTCLFIILFFSQFFEQTTISIVISL